MNSTELCETLLIPRKTLTAWKKRGLPFAKQGRAHVFDEQTVTTWLLDEGLFVAPPCVVKTQQKAADGLNISVRQLQRWIAAGCPGTPGAYDLDAIAAWKDERDGRKSNPMRGPADAALTRYRQAKADLAELDLENARRQSIPQHELTIFFEEWASQGSGPLVALDERFGSEAGDLVRDWMKATARALEALKGTP